MDSHTIDERIHEKDADHLRQPNTSKHSQTLDQRSSKVHPIKRDEKPKDPSDVVKRKQATLPKLRYDPNVEFVPKTEAIIRNEQKSQIKLSKLEPTFSVDP